MAGTEKPQIKKTTAFVTKQAPPYTGEPPKSARQKVAGKIGLSLGKVGDLPRIVCACSCFNDCVPVCWSVCTPHQCACICECSSICNCDCSCGACDCACGSVLLDQFAAIGHRLAVIRNRVATIGNQLNAIASQGVIIGRRGVAIGNRLSTIEATLKTRFGDIDGILKNLAKKRG